MTQETPRKMLQLIVPPPLAEAVKVAAARQFLSLSDYTRGALLSRMRSEGIDPTAECDVPASPHKGSSAASVA